MKLLRLLAFGLALALTAPAWATDTADNEILAAAIRDPVFQARVKFRFVVAAISVTTESVNTVSHTQRLAFAGALFAGTVDPALLAQLALANATNRANALTSPQTAGGVILDNDIDFQIASVFTGVATARSW